MGTREAALGPTVGRAVSVEESVLLFEAKPGNFFLGLLHDLCGMVTVVGPVRGSVIVVGLSENENVISATEGIFEYGGWSEVDIGIVTRGLVGGRAIKVPNTERTNIGHLLAHGLVRTIMGDQGIENRRKGRRTVLFERRPLSPSIQTSDGVVKGAGDKKIGERTFSLDLVTLGEGKVGSKKVVVIDVGHWWW